MVNIIPSEIVDINLLKKAEYNPRSISIENFNGLKKNIEDFGFLDPIIVNMYEGREWVIIGGNLRYEIMKLKGEPLVEVKKVCVDPIRERKLNIQLNNQTGNNDDQMLAELLYKLQEEGENLDDLGFSDQELTKLLNDVAGDITQDDLNSDICPNCGQKIKNKHETI